MRGPVPDRQEVHPRADLEGVLLTLVAQLVRELHPRQTKGAGVTLESTLERDLGLDSLGRVELLARVERAFEVRLPAQLLSTAETVRDLLHAVQSATLVRPERWLWAIHTHRGTISGAPNFAYELCVRRLEDRDLTGLDLSSWRLALNGDEPVSPDTIRRFSERFALYGFRPEAMTPVYGLSVVPVSCCAQTSGAYAAVRYA